MSPGCATRAIWWWWRGRAGANIVLALAAALLLHVPAWCGGNDHLGWAEFAELVSPKSDFGGFQSAADSAIGWWSDLDQPVAYPAAIRLAAMERSGLVLLVGLIFLLPFVGIS